MIVLCVKGLRVHQTCYQVERTYELAYQIATDLSGDGTYNRTLGQYCTPYMWSKYSTRFIIEPLRYAIYLYHIQVYV